WLALARRPAGGSRARSAAAQADRAEAGPTGPLSVHDVARHPARGGRRAADRGVRRGPAPYEHVRLAELQRAVAFIDFHRLPVPDVAAQDRVGERVLQIFLHRALQRTRAIDRIIADPAQPGAGAINKIKTNLT